MLFQGLEVLILILVLATLGFCFYLIKKFGYGTLVVPFSYFFVGVLLVGLSRIFLFLTDLGYYDLHDVTLHIWWHLIAYFGMFAFILAGRKIQQISTNPVSAGWNTMDKIAIGSFIVNAALIFLIAQPVETPLSELFVGSFVDLFGLHHFLLFIFAFFAGFYIYRAKTSFARVLPAGVTPILIFLVLIGLQHLWELITESWKLIELPIETIEQVEQFIIIPALVFLIFGFMRIAFGLKKQ